MGRFHEMDKYILVELHHIVINNGDWHSGPGLVTSKANRYRNWRVIRRIENIGSAVRIGGVRIGDRERIGIIRACLRRKTEKVNGFERDSSRTTSREEDLDPNIAAIFVGAINRGFDAETCPVVVDFDDTQAGIGC